VIWVDNDALLPTQNTISGVGKIESRGGKENKLGAPAPNHFLPMPTSSKTVPVPMA